MDNVYLVITDRKGKQYALRAEIRFALKSEDKQDNARAFWHLVNCARERLQELLYI